MPIDVEQMSYRELEELVSVLESEIEKIMYNYKETLKGLNQTLASVETEIYSREKTLLEGLK